MTTGMTATEDAIFDARHYDLPIPKDSRGRKADKLALAVGGTLELDRTSEEDLELINGIRNGSVTEVLIRATLAGESWTFSEDEDGNAEPKVQVRVKAVSVEAA